MSNASFSDSVVNDNEVFIAQDDIAEAEPKQSIPSAIEALSFSKVRKIGFSLADQVLAVSGMFLANIALARAQSKQEYGMFALSYSVYTFLTGFHNALILEPYSIHGPGRYHERLSAY